MFWIGENSNDLLFQPPPNQSYEEEVDVSPMTLSDIVTAWKKVKKESFSINLNSIAIYS